MFIYDGLFLICCCLGLVIIAIFFTAIFFGLGLNTKREARRKEFKEKLENFKKKRAENGKTSKSTPTNNAEDAEFREVK